MGRGGTAVHHLLRCTPEELVWKALFWIGIAPAGLVFWIRRHVEEPAPSVQRAQPVGFSDSSSGS